jgi:septum formation protein
MQAASPALTLASASVARRALLQSAGLVFDTCPAFIDEAAVKRDAGRDGLSAGDAALLLALLKARAVARPGLVIGCDQILVCDGLWFDKPADLHTARGQLRALRGRTHSLATAMVVLRDGMELWRHLAMPHLTMRAFSDGFLDFYIKAEGAALLSSVGAYRLEGLGVHLFESVAGEHSAILGLPLLPLLGFLRECDMIGR